MDINEQDVLSLFRKWLADTTTVEEDKLLLEIFDRQDAKQIFAPALKAHWEELKLMDPGASASLTIPQFPEKAHDRARLILDKYPPQSFEEREDELNTQSAVEAEDHPPTEDFTGFPARIHFLKTTWLKYAAAIVIMVGSSVYFWNYSDKTEPPAAKLDNKQTDVSPGGEKAVLTLADGTKIVLDEAVNGQLANQGGVHVVKLANGQVAYDLRGLTSNSKDVMLNTIATPRGGQYQVALPDGTKVWLNAFSSITFPAAFITDKREVKITGEVYFEVAKDKKRPFIVDVDGRANVKVLGTSFNINSYSDESSIKTTLIEGSLAVAVSSDREQKTNEAILKPGQQAIASSSDQQLQVVDGNIGQALAWKNGIFDFTGADLKTVMRQLERWYDINVHFTDSISNLSFEGRMYRNVNLSDVLEVLKEMGVKFELNGKNLTVL